MESYDAPVIYHAVEVVGTWETSSVSSDEPSPPAGSATSQRIYKAGLAKDLLKKMRSHNKSVVSDKFITMSTAAKKATIVGSDKLVTMSTAAKKATIVASDKLATMSTAAKKATIRRSTVKTGPVNSENKNQTNTVLQEQEQRNDAPEAEEAREAEEDATDNTKPSTHRAIPNAGEREDVEDVEEETAATSTTIGKINLPVLTTTAIEKIAGNSIPLPNDAGLNGANEETTETGDRKVFFKKESAAASPTMAIIDKIAEKNDVLILRGLSGFEKITEEYGDPLLIAAKSFSEETTKVAKKIEKSTGIFSSIEKATDAAFESYLGEDAEDLEDIIYTEVNKFNGSASQVVNQTVDDLVDAGEDLSLITNALCRTKTANKLLKCVDHQISKNGGLTLTGPTRCRSLKWWVDPHWTHTLPKLADTSLHMDDANDMAASHAAHTIASPKSLNPLVDGDVEYDQESEGEGMEISLTEKIGDTRTLAEI